jgi:hypothetical protein
LVIDRMDLVELRVRDFVDELVKLVRDEEVRVKVFAVMDSVRSGMRICALLMRGYWRCKDWIRR